MPLTVCFVRHGESQANVDRIFANRVDQQAELTATGVGQARVLAGTLRQQRITHVYTSPLPRARQTADVIAATLGVPVAVADALREYDVGDFEGLPYGGAHAWRWDEHARVELAWRDGDLDARHPGGESASDIAARFLPFMRALAKRHGDTDRLALVGHGGLYLIALPLLFQTLTIDDARRFGLGHCEIVRASWDGDCWTCQRWGDHLIPEAIS
jgi:broad specificity phosphatase PhoE